MNDKYYVVAVDDVGFGHGDELILIKLKNNTIVGYSVEFDVCTENVKEACENTFAEWCGLDDNIEFEAAPISDIIAIGLDKYLIGTKKDMKVSTKTDKI
jgi:hypothetical protein